MNKYRIALAILASVLASTAYGLSADQRQGLINSLVRVESGGRSHLIGDSGKAYGILQIHAEMVADANRIAGTTYSHDDMFDPAKARRVADIVLSHYDSYIKRTTGREATAKELAFIWNGGGSAWKRVSSPRSDSKQTNLERYWSKVSSK